MLMNSAEQERLYGDFKRLYLADYQKTWDDVLARVKLRPQPTNNQLVESLDLLSRNDSPMKLLLELVEKNTTLGKLSSDFAAQVLPNLQPRLSLFRKPRKKC